MFSHSFYLNLHLLGIFLTMTSLSALSIMTVVGREQCPPALVRSTSIAHGIALLFVLVGGFGMFARLGISGVWPGWVVAKLVIWVVFAAAIAPIKRRAALARVAWVALPALGVLAAYFAVYKPL